MQVLEEILSTPWMPMVTQSSYQPVRRKRSRKGSRRRPTLKPRLRLKQPEELRLKRPQLPKGRKEVKRVVVAPWLSLQERSNDLSQKLRLLLMPRTKPERKKKRGYQMKRKESKERRKRRGTPRNKPRETGFKS